MQPTMSEAAMRLQAGFEAGALKPPAIEIVPFEKAADSYTRVAD